jgi:hypothetical protein
MAKLYNRIVKKVKFALEQAMKPQKGSGRIDVLFLYPRRQMVVGG